MTRVLLLAFAAFGLSGAAHADEGLAVSPMPFSRDGKYFAFEQYGTPGGLGYSEIQIIDVAANRPKDAPIVVDMSSLKKPAPESEGREPLDLIREASRTRAIAPMRQLQMTEPGVRVGFVRPSRSRDTLNEGEVADVEKAIVTRYALDPAVMGAGAQLVLREIEAPAEHCKDELTRGAKGFALVLERTGKPPLTLHNDTAVPTTRRCPRRYGLAEAHALALPSGTISLAVLVQTFETTPQGPQRRFVPATAQFK